jgi:hypothetical protein
MKGPFNPQREGFNMFNLEAKIAEWRRQMLAAGIKTPMPLDELESHLREDFRVFVSAGKPEDQAFELAVSRLGSPGPLRTEFNKLKKPSWWPVTIGSWLFTGAIVVTAAGLSKGLVDGRLSILLFGHILSVTAGYGAAFLAGAFGMLYVAHRLFQAMTPDRQKSLDRAVLLLSQLSAGLVIAALLLGMIWCHQHRGRFLLGDAKEIGAICVAIWFIALSVTKRRRQVSERATMLMCIGGNVIVSLAWFGAAIYNDGQRMQVGWARFLPLGLAVFVGIHLLLLVMGIAFAAAKMES